MPEKFGTTRSTRYVNLSDQVKRAVAGRTEALVAGAAESIRDGIVQVIDESDPRGRVYDGHAAAAPGQPPAVRSGAYRSHWKASGALLHEGRIRAFVYNDLRVDFIPLWVILEFGRSASRKRSARKAGSSRGGASAPRPHVEQGANRALVEIRGRGLPRAA